MRKETQDMRKAQIEEAAYALLREKGYAGASMLSVAKRAKASNETLYRWYGDKQGLFLSMVHSNADATKTILADAIAQGLDPMDTLDLVAPILLSMLLGDRAVCLNRAAAADPSNELGKAISQGGREVIAPLIGQVLDRLLHARDVSDLTVQQASSMYFGLLIGDLQIRRAIGVLPEPTAQEIGEICTLAKANFLKMLDARP